MRLKTLLLGFFFSVQAFASENIILNFHNNTDEETLSYAILLQSINKYACLSELSNTNTTNFAENAYRDCNQKARENGKELKDAYGNPLYYTTCEFYIFSSPKCTGKKIGTISLDRGPRSNKYANETTINNSNQLSVRTRNDDEYDINNNLGSKGYVILKSKDKEKLNISVQNTIYYMIKNKSNTHLTISINSPCDSEAKIEDITIPHLFPGSTWSIPNFWIYDKCKESATCSIYLHEIIKTKGQKGICGNIIGAIDMDLDHKNDELISLYDYRYQISILPYLKSSFKVRRVFTITNQINKEIMP